MKHVACLVALFVLPGMASAQGYGLSRAPAPPRPRAAPPTDYGSRYDRDRAAWQDRRQRCLDAGQRHKRAPERCNELQAMPPLSSDYVKPAAVK